MGQRDGQRPAFGRAERAGFLADEDDGRLAADGQRRTGRLDRLQRGDLLAGTHPGQHSGRNGGDLPDDGGGRLRFAGDRTCRGGAELDGDQRHQHSQLRLLLWMLPSCL